jgi:cell division protein FtsI/penicillin-binding protein 2
MLGTVGPITADRLKQLGAPYKVGDEVGLSGLQNVYETRLAGTPATDVVIADAKGKTVRAIKHFPGKAPQPVRLTIDPATQSAAETALAGVTKNAALVAVDTTTGAIRAVVSKPDGGFDRALAGTYPPGSTFKVITSAALLTAGDNGSTPAPCPATITVDGRTFQNFEGEASASLDLTEAFAESCNNAFIRLGDMLSSDALPKAAASFGFNTHWSLGIEAAGGSFPKPVDRAELAASAIGQGRVLASPVQMASVAAAVAAGQWHAPTLVSTPQPKAAPVVPPLSPSVVATLKTFMAGVIRGKGTAAGARLPADSYGKTGTAEFGNGSPPPTHAWYIGFRGNLAFAVIVEDGGVGGRVAAPLAAGFLNTLAP